MRAIVRSWLLCTLVLGVGGCHDRAGSSGGGGGGGPNGACNSGTPSATARPLVSGQDRPFALAVDDTAIYWSETGARETVRRADKADGGNLVTLVTESLAAPEDLVVDDLYVYYRTPTIKRISKTTPGAATVLASGFDDLHSYGLVVDGGDIFFAGRDSAHGNADVVMRMDRDGGNQTMLVSATSAVHLVAVDAANVYYTLDLASGGMQLAVARTGGTPVVMGSGEACFDAAIDATYLYCSGVTHPFKLRLAGGSQIPLCKTDLTFSANTQGRLALAHDRIFLLAIPHSPELEQPPRSGTVLDVSTFAGGHAWAGGVDDPRTEVTDGVALYYSENRLGSIMKLDL